MNKLKEFLNTRKFRQGSIATGVTLLVLAIVVVLNMVVGTLSQRYSLQLDLTPDKIFEISDVTLDFLDSLTEEVTIYVLNSEQSFTGGNTYLIQANEVIAKYDKASDKVTVTYIDLVRNPGFAARYPEQEIVTNNILVTSRDRIRVLTPYDLFDIESVDIYTSYITGSRAEQAMTSAISGVTTDKVVTLALLSGHNESVMDGFSSLLELNNYHLIDVNILTEEIPPEAAVAILSAPTRDYTEEELDKLDAYLSNGGQLGKTLFYLAGIDQPETPVLDAFLAEWGVIVDSGVVFETDMSRILNLNPYYPIVDYTYSLYGDNLQSRSLYTASPISRPVYVLSDTNGRQVTTLLQFSASTGVQPLDADETWQPSEEDMVGAIPSLVLSRQVGYLGADPVYSSVLVSGSSMAVSDSFLASTTIANSEYFMLVLNDLAEKEDETFIIQSKQMTSAQLGLSSLQAVTISLLLMIVLPVILLICGAVVFFRRRHL